MTTPIPPGWELPEEIEERLGEKAGRQRAMIADGHLLLVLHRVPQPSQSAREGIFFWRTPTGDWRFSGGGPGLFHLKQHLEEFSAAVEQLETRYDQADDATEYFRILEAAVPIHRTAKNLYNTLQGARDALPDARELIALRDWAYDIDRASDLLTIDAKNALDYSIAKQGEEQSRLADEMAQTGHRINILAAIFLPVATVTSVFGMNMPHGLENASPAVYWLIILWGLALGGAILRMVSPRKGTK